MKRHPKLQPFSDEHHRALVLARRTRRAANESGARESLAEIWRDVQARFAAELEPHFQAEEAWFFPWLEKGGDTERAARALGEHGRLRELARSPVDSVTARDFAELLERHIRFEEREISPQLEIALAAYEDAAIRGLCREGAEEAAVGALRAARSALPGLDQDLRVHLRRGE